MSEMILILAACIWSAVVGHDFGRYRSRKAQARNPGSLHAAGLMIYQACGRVSFMEKFVDNDLGYFVTCEVNCEGQQYHLTVRSDRQEISA
jgi:hypothetical protein